MDNLIYNIAQQLKEASDTPLLDARYFVAETTDEKILNSFISRRKKGEPVSKIIGHKGFWSLELKVSADTLDPRPDTETIIDAVLKLFPDKSTPLHFLDLGTGSGCLLLALLSEYVHAQGIGIDASDKALIIARENGKTFKQAAFLNRNWMDLNWGRDLGAFDVIVSNPPYIPTKDIQNLDKEVRCYDPLIALDGGDDGLDAYRCIFNTIVPLLKKEGLLFLEIGKDQEKDVLSEGISAGFKLVDMKRDLKNIIRCLIFQKS